MSAENPSMENRCRCCLINGRHKDMWAEYVKDGEVEVYGEMLKECFQFSWTEPSDHLEQICKGCIMKLRVSLDFRREILCSEEALMGFTHNDSKDDKELMKVKLEAEEGDDIIIEYEYQEVDSREAEYVEIGEETQEDFADEEAEYLSCDLDGGSPAGDMEVEYLEDDAEAKTAIKTVTQDTSKTKSGKHKYKQYTQSDLEMALEMVASNKMTRSQAALKYKVPVKTLGFKLRAMDNEEDTESKYKPNPFHEEIRMILTYTNATPYKTKVGRLFCAYCSTDGPIFDTPESLRTHTRTDHFSDRIKNVEIFMRPNYLNEVIKVDIENLHCTVCTAPIDHWNSMFEHLRDKHEVELDLAYTKVIPYILDDDILCCLCKQKFSHFHLLDVHMNSHYNNYICGECGDTFLSENRMKKHAETHSTKKYPCSLCGKIFTLEKYRKKHFDGVHLKERKFKCIYCSKMFNQDYSRHLHVIEEHNEKVKPLHCEYCDMSFTWRPYYLKHIRLNHTKPEKKFSCKLCPKKFNLKSELKHHEDWHVGKGYTCHVCQKKFSSKNYLQKHIAVHSKDEASGAENKEIYCVPIEQIVEFKKADEEVVTGE